MENNVAGPLRLHVPPLCRCPTDHSGSLNLKKHQNKQSLSLSVLIGGGSDRSLPLEEGHVVGKAADRFLGILLRAGMLPGSVWEGREGGGGGRMCVVEGEWKVILLFRLK